MQIDKINSQQVDFLDLTLFKDETPGGWYQILYKPFRKTSSQKIYLGESSMHAPGCLLSWPMAEIRRLRLRSNRQQDFETAKTRFLQDLRQVVTNTNLLARLEAVGFEAPRFPRHEKRLKHFWLVLPFHPLLHEAGIGNVASNVVHRWLSVLGCLKEPFKIRVAWSNATQHMHVRLTGKTTSKFLAGAQG